MLLIFFKKITFHKSINNKEINRRIWIQSFQATYYISARLTYFKNIIIFAPVFQDIKSQFQDFV